MGLHIPGSETVGNAGRGKETLLDSVAQRGGTALRDDTGRVTGALRRAVEAEGRFRSIVDEAQPGRMQEAAAQFGKVPKSALSGSTDPVEQAAVVGQLDLGMALHEDRLRLRAMKDRAQEMQQLREERMAGMLRDAGDAGGMAGMSASPELQQRAFGHLSNALLSMEQTYRATGQALGEAREATDQRIRSTRSGMTGAFLARMAQDNPSHAHALLGQLGGTLEEHDLEKTRSAVKSAVENHAISTLEERFRRDDGVDYDGALGDLAGMADMPEFDDTSRNTVRERLEMSRARQAYQKGKDDAAQRAQTFEGFYKAVDEGDVQVARTLLDRDSALDEKVRGRMRESLKADKWETKPDALIKTVDLIGKGKIKDAYMIVPDRDMSHADASVLRDLMDRKGPRADLENRMFHRGVETVLGQMDGAKPEDKAAAVRTLFAALKDSRDKGEDAVLLFTPGKKGNIIDGMTTAYGTGKKMAEDEKGPLWSHGGLGKPEEKVPRLYPDGTGWGKDRSGNGEQGSGGADSNRPDSNRPDRDLPDPDRPNRKRPDRKHLDRFNPDLLRPELLPDTGSGGVTKPPAGTGGLSRGSALFEKPDGIPVVSFLPGIIGDDSTYMVEKL